MRDHVKVSDCLDFEGRCLNASFDVLREPHDVLPNERDHTLPRDVQFEHLQFSEPHGKPAWMSATRS